MGKTDFKSVDEYIASQSEAIQGILGRVRTTIRRAVPEAEEMIGRIAKFRAKEVAGREKSKAAAPKKR